MRACLPACLLTAAHYRRRRTQVPVFFVVTKIDLAPEHVLKHTLATLQAVLKKPGVKKRPFLVRWGRGYRRGGRGSRRGGRGGGRGMD